MKLLSLVLASGSFAQDEGSDKWVGYDYGSYGGFSYGSYDNNPGAKFVNEATDNGAGGRAGNGLSCFTCHGRLRMGSEEDNGSPTENNAWYHCADTGADVECKGDQRSCLTEERRRYDVVVEVLAGCKNPEACMYLWRRNERYMPLFHHYGDQTESADPDFFDDECRSTSHHKHLSHRAQWESTCRSCCAADDSGVGCNSPAAGGPIGFHCNGSGGCAGALLSSSMYGSYSIANIPGFMDAAMEFGRAHPGEGRNSAPEDKFVARTDAAGNPLMEQADRLSTEDTDFHNNRHGLTGNSGGAFGSK